MGVDSNACSGATDRPKVKGNLVAGAGCGWEELHPGDEGSLWVTPTILALWALAGSYFAFSFVFVAARK